MGKIQIIKDKKTGQEKYLTILPKATFDDFATQAGDALLLKSVVGNEITFKFIRKE
jgi:hypothetical protein